MFEAETVNADLNPACEIFFMNLFIYFHECSTAKQQTLGR